MTTATFVSISCQRCGLTSTVPVDALLVSVAVDGAHDGAHDGTAGSLAWTCDRCADLVTARLDWPALLTLVTAGVTVLDDSSDRSGATDGDALPPHPEHPAGGTPLTRDDLLALHELLGSDRWFDQVADAEQR
jgi:hypothetical protein